MGLFEEGIAVIFGDVLGALYGNGTLHRSKESPTYDIQGNVTGYAGGGDVAIKLQRDTASWAMRQGEGFVEGDCSIIVLTQPSDITVTTEHEITDAGGKRWKVMSADLDAASSHWVCRARAA